MRHRLPPLACTGLPAASRPKRASLNVAFIGRKSCCTRASTAAGSAPDVQEAAERRGVSMADAEYEIPHARIRQDSACGILRSHSAFGRRRQALRDAVPGYRAAVAVSKKNAMNFGANAAGFGWNAGSSRREASTFTRAAARSDSSRRFEYS